MQETATTTAGDAVVWWSIREACWLCDAGGNVSRHYNEADAIRHGQRFAAAVRRGSVVREVDLSVAILTRVTVEG